VLALYHEAVNALADQLESADIAPYCQAPTAEECYAESNASPALSDRKPGFVPPPLSLACLLECVTSSLFLHEGYRVSVTIAV
jgi:hypothetical protein